MGRVLIALAALGLAGCASGARLTPPAPFVTLDPANDGYRERHVTADGVVLSLRDVENRPRGPLSFWVQAIRSRLRRAGAYELEDEQDVRAASGETGRQMRFARDHGRRAYVYWITVFVDGDRLVMVEAGGREDRFTPLADDVARSIAGLRLR